MLEKRFHRIFEAVPSRRIAYDLNERPCYAKNSRIELPACRYRRCPFDELRGALIDDRVGGENELSGA